MRVRWKGAAGVALTLLVVFPLPAASQDAMDDVLGGFDDEDPDFAVDEEALQALDVEQGWWDVSGSVDISGSVNFRDHRSATGTSYEGLQRLRNRLNLQLDLVLGELPFLPASGRRELEGWKLRLEGWGFYDAAYLINGRGQYTEQVRNEYELDAEVGEFWIQGSLSESVDVKIGRQIVIWGRSESLRVLDVLNPLDNREPGRVDLEDLRRPLGMLKLDAYFGDWTLTGIAIPEIRFDLLPVVGSDFFPVPFSIPERVPSDWDDTEAAVRLTGTFEGWDMSLNAAWFWNDAGRFRDGPFPAQFTHDRLWLVGGAGNFTSGSWLLKTELALVGGLGYFNVGPKERIDFLAGVEYYGFQNTTMTLEILNRHVLNHEAAMLVLPNVTREDSQEISARVTRTFMNERLSITALAIVFGIDADDGVIARLDGSYDIRDALSVGLGVLFYFEGELPPFDSFQRNDRVFFNLKWSF